jgi:hypothetical protein
MLSVSPLQISMKELSFFWKTAGEMLVVYYNNENEGVTGIGLRFMFNYTGSAA